MSDQGRAAKRRPRRSDAAERAADPAAEEAEDAYRAMTRSDLVGQLTERFSQLTQRDTDLAVRTILDAMADALGRGHRIEIRGFGSFSITRRPPRIGRNPRSGEQVTIPEKLVPHFKPGKALREGVDGAPVEAVSKRNGGKR